MLILTEERACGPSTYRVCVRERIDPYWSSWLYDMEIREGNRGETILIGPLPDQTALFGLLTRIRDMQLTLLSLQLMGFRLESEFPED